MNIFITGGASGIGKASVKKFYDEGENVFFVDKNEEASIKLIKSFDEKNRIGFYHCDVSKSKELNISVQKALKKFGKIDSVFVNAGTHLSADILSTDEEMWDNIINTNLKSVFLTIKATLKYVMKSKQGSYILMGSDQSLIGKKKSFAYGTTKGAIAQMTKSLALDYAKDNIRFNCVCPATIDTPLSRQALKNYSNLKENDDISQILEEEKALHPLGRIGHPKEVANVVYFLASKESSFVTGTLIPIDGGYTAK